MNPLNILDNIKSDTLTKLIIDNNLLNNNIDYIQYLSYNDYLNDLFLNTINCKNLKTLKIIIINSNNNDDIILTDDNINNLSLMLKENKSITHLNFDIFINIQYNNYLKIFNAIKHHNILTNITYNFNFNLLNSDIEYQMIQSLETQHNLEKIKLTKYNYNFNIKSCYKFSEIINNNNYISYFNISNINFNNNDNLIINSLSSKKYLEYLILNDIFVNITVLIKVIHHNKYLRQLNVYDNLTMDLTNSLIPSTISEDIIIKTINKSRINYLYIKDDKSNNNFILKYMIQNNKIDKLDLDMFYSYDNRYIQYLEYNTSITDLNININQNCFINDNYLMNNNLNNLIHLLINNKNIRKLRIINIFIDDAIILMNYLKNNKTLYVLKLSISMDPYSKNLLQNFDINKSFNTFINSLSELITNNKTLYNITIKNSYSYNFRLKNIRNISYYLKNQHYDKIKSAVYNNVSLVKLKWNKLNVLDNGEEEIEEEIEEKTEEEIEEKTDDETDDETDDVTEEEIEEETEEETEEEIEEETEEEIEEETEEEIEKETEEKTEDETDDEFDYEESDDNSKIYLIFSIIIIIIYFYYIFRHYYS